MNWTDGRPVLPGDLFRVRIGGGRPALGKVTRVKATSPTGPVVTLTRIKDDGDEFGASNEIHLILAKPEDFVRRMELDNFYGIVVPFGKTKIHRANRAKGG